MKLFVTKNLLMCGAIMASSLSLAAQKAHEVGVELRNCKQTSDKEFTFDVWVTNNSPEHTAKLNMIQIGLDIDKTAIANGGTLKTSLVEGNKNLPGKQHRPSPSLGNGNASNHWRLPALTTDKNSAVTIPSEGLYYGTFSISNSVPFTSGSNPNLTFVTNQAVGKTRTAVGMYVDGAAVAGTGFTAEGSIPAPTAITVNPALRTIKTGSCKLVLNKPASVGKIDLEQLISVSPNPFTNFIILQSDYTWNNATATITTVKGDEVQRATINGSQYTFQVKDIAKGVYFLTIEDSKGKYTKRIVKE